MPKFLFITGAHKSGTSWLARMVAAHPKIAIAPHELWLMGHPDGLMECIERSIAEWFKLPTVKSGFQTEKRVASATQKIVRAALRGAMAAGVGNLKGVEVLGDKTPAFYAKNVQRLKQIFPDAYYVQIVRDPRDVIVSHHYHAYRLNEWRFFTDEDKAKRVKAKIERGEDVGRDLLDGGALKRKVRHWIEIQTGGIEAKELFANRCYMLRYEDLLVEPAKHLQAIFALLGAALTEENVAAIVASHSFESMTKGRPAGQQDTNSFFRRGVSGDWKNYFSDAQNELVIDAARPLMERFAYLEG